MSDTSFYPEPFIIPPTAPHKQTLILLHGTSQTGPTFAESFMLPFSSQKPNNSSPTNGSDHIHEVQKTTLAEYFPCCKFVFPTGARRKTTVFGGKETNAWFDVTDFGDRTKGEMEMREGMRESSIYLSQLIKSEIRALYEGRAMEEAQKNDVETGGHEMKGRVMLAGFSQGCAMGMMLLLGGELERLGVLGGFGGFVGLSGWLGFRRQINETISDSPSISEAVGDLVAKRKVTSAYLRKLLELDPPGEVWNLSTKGLNKPIFLGHGESDLKMKFEWGGQMRDTLVNLGMNVNFHSYEGLAHWWNDNEMSDVVKFLEKNWDS